MKHSKLIPIIAILMLVATTVPAYALDVGLNGTLDIKAQNNQDRYNDDKKDDKGMNDSNDDDRKSNSSRDDAQKNGMFANRIRAWIVNTGTIGQVTAVNTGSITVKTSSGEIFVVTTADASIRHVENNSSSAIAVRDNVYVFGIKNANTIVASMIIVGKNKDEVKPTNEEKRQAYFGVVTAKSDTTLTILSANNISYTVSLGADAQIWINKTKQSSLAGFVVGDNVMVQGDVSGSNIVAKKLLAIHLPAGTVAGKITAISGTTLTILGSDNKTYTVTTVDADIKTKKDRDAEASDLKVGGSVVVKGDVSGTNSIDADVVTEAKLGFFHRFGLFFKGIFGKK
jgi:hypothetical protein